MNLKWPAAKIGGNGVWIKQETKTKVGSVHWIIYILSLMKSSRTLTKITRKGEKKPKNNWMWEQAEASLE